MYAPEHHCSIVGHSQNQPSLAAEYSDHTPPSKIACQCAHKCSWCDLFRESWWDHQRKLTQHAFPLRYPLVPLCLPSPPQTVADAPKSASFYAQIIQTMYFRPSRKPKTACKAKSRNRASIWITLAICLTFMTYFVSSVPGFIIFVQRATWRWSHAKVE